MLDISPGGTYIDATVGLGGHAERMLAKMKGGRLIGIDRDEAALNAARERLKDGQVILRQGKFSDLEDLLSGLGVHAVDGVLFDFGVSMMQFKSPGRGFSFSSDEPLDMRMDRRQNLTAGDIVNTYSERELERILEEYGEERFARKIAKTLVALRVKQSITTCVELAGIVSTVIRRRGKHHPATKTFQALRIAVNDEIAEIAKGLAGAIGLLRPGGRLCTIAYHSLEDRTVKNFMRNAQHEGLIRILTKKPLTPSYDEIRSNPSSRSAKLRGAEKV